jgi:hypothetical protein
LLIAHTAVRFRFNWSVRLQRGLTARSTERQGSRHLQNAKASAGRG